MEDVKDIYIAGIDENRPPTIRKEPYIDLYFRLSRQAPEAWCKEFNDLTASMDSSPKVDPAKGLFINTWVRKPDDIPAHLQLLNAKVLECTERYLARIELARQAERRAGADVAASGGPQGLLNKIIAGLTFSHGNKRPPGR
jgi:hypothetical protein